MKFLLRITGPNINQEVAVPATGADLTIGRDANADVVLPDPDKWISRKHVALHQAEDVLELLVTSTVNGIETSRGAVERSRSIQLTVGDFLKLGAYRIDLVAGDAAAPAPAFNADDPFAALLGSNAPVARGDDPFSRPEFRPATVATKATSDDPFSELAGLGANNHPGSAARPNAGTVFSLDQFGGPSPTPRSGPGDVLSSLGAGTAAPALNDWLGGAGTAGAIQGNAGAGPLDAFLGRAAPAAARTLSPEHVHGINMPMSFGPTAAASHKGVAMPLSNRPVAAPPAVASDAMRISDPNADVWANLTQGLDIALPIGSVVEPTAVTPPPRPSSPSQSVIPSTLDDVFANIGGSSDDDAFADWSASATLPVGSVDPRIRAGTYPGQPPKNVQTDVAPVAVAVTTQAARGPAHTQADAARSEGNAVWAAFGRGLGMQGSDPANEQAAERAGAMVRLVIEGLAVLLAARADLKRELRAEDRTMLSGRDNNPLKLQLSGAELIEYLFASQASAGYMPAERAVRESIAELGIHEHATIAAARAAVEGALRDFEPNRMKKQLTKGKSGMFQLLDKAKLWDAYQQNYEKQSQQMADWLESVFNRHFMPTYSRETERLKTQQAPPNSV